MYREYLIKFNSEIKTVDILFSSKEILEIITYPREYPLIQLKFEVNTMKITENGTVVYSKIYVPKIFYTECYSGRITVEIYTSI